MQVKGFILLLCACTASTASGDLFGITGASGLPSILFTIDPVNPSTTTVIGNTGLTHITGISFHPITGELYAHRSPFFVSGELYRLNPTSAAAEFVGFTNLTSPDLAFRSDGTLFGWLEFHDNLKFPTDDVDDLVTFDLATGAATQVGDSGIFPSRNGLAFDSHDNLYLKGFDGADTKIYLLDQMSGVATEMLTLDRPPASNPNAQHPANVLAFNGDVAYTIERRNTGTFLKTINLTTGELTELGDIGIAGVSAIAFRSQAIPEPSSMLLGSVAIGGAWLLRRRFGKFYP